MRELSTNPKAVAKRKYRAEHPEKEVARYQRWYGKHKAAQPARLRMKIYGLSETVWNGLLERQAGLCAICCEPMVPGRGTHIDHDHATGEIRGLLCHNCNGGLGKFRDTPEFLSAAIDYLKVA